LEFPYRGTKNLQQGLQSSFGASVALQDSRTTTTAHFVLCCSAAVRLERWMHVVAFHEFHNNFWRCFFIRLVFSTSKLCKANETQHLIDV
jgi:hypothetical protein